MSLASWNTNCSRLSNKTYQEQEILTLSPNQLVTKIYDIIILACAQKNQTKASDALVELISALDFQYQDIALGLFRLYEYCLRIVKLEKFEEVSGLIKELRETWIEATEKGVKMAS